MSSVLESVFLFPLEQIAQQGDIAQQRYLGDGFRVGVLYQAANDDRLAVGRVNDRIGQADVNDRGADVVPLAPVEMGMERVGSIWEIWGETIISTMPSLVMNGVTSRMTPTADR